MVRELETIRTMIRLGAAIGGLVAMLLVGSAAMAAPPATNADDDPTRFVGGVSAEYLRSYGNQIETGTAGGSNRIQISFQPWVAVLPASITIDLDQLDHPRPGAVITQADITLLRLWIANLLTYHRNTDASIEHGLEVLSANVPVFARDFAGRDVQTTMIVTVGGGFGYRVLSELDRKDGTPAVSRHGLYLEPRAALIASSEILNRIFVTAFASVSATAQTGSAPNSLSGAIGAKVAVKLTPDNRLRFFLNGTIHHYGLNEGSGLPASAAYLGAGLEWGEPQPVLNDLWGSRRH